LDEIHRLDHHAIARMHVGIVEQLEIGHQAAGPTPSMRRPLLMWSNCAASAATIAG
jgi:hypothetical protein